ncbi:MAG: DedA family protein [Nitrospirae bacterium]|nr:DedA family protein [Nitrospirota bacterium]
MIGAIITKISLFILFSISSFGYAGIIVMMAIESASIPLPSEIIMPFAGYLAGRGDFNLVLVALSGAFGCLVGSMAAYMAGKYGGRPWIERYGRYLLISRRDLERAEGWFSRYGELIIFFSRLLPVVRTFISLPAGVARMNVLRFAVYTFLGSIPWCFGLAYIGAVLGENWHMLEGYFHKFDILIGMGILGTIIYIVWHHRPDFMRA